MAQFKGGGVQDYNSGFNLYAGMIQKSRTYVDGIKAAKVAGNTTVRIEDSKLIFRLYNTDIFTATPDGFTINTGGYNTVTTRDRLNSIAPVRVWTDKGTPYAHAKPFATYIRFNWNCQELESDASDLDKVKAMRKEIDKLIDKYLDNPVEPSNGDCWHCLFMGPTKDCMLSHIEEMYTHGSLYVQALKFCGYTMDGTRYWFNSLRKGDKYARTLIKRAMRRFIRHTVEVEKSPVATNPYVGINN